MRRGFRLGAGPGMLVASSNVQRMSMASQQQSFTSAWDMPSWGTDNVQVDPATGAPVSVWGSGSGRGNGGVQFWGGSTGNEQWQKLNAPPSEEKSVRALTPQAVLQTVREDPGMNTAYYARRYFGGATPTTVATLTHIFWSQLKKYGKVTISREPGKEEDPDGLLWMPLRRERGRITHVKHHKSESEDLELLKDYVPPAPSLEQVGSGDQIGRPVRARRVPFHHRDTNPADLQQQQQELAFQQQQQQMGGGGGAFWGQGIPTSENPAGANPQYAAQYSSQNYPTDGGIYNGGFAGVGGGGEGGGQGGAGSQQLNPLNISDDLKATVELVMKQLLAAIHEEPNMTMNHYTNHHLKSDEHRLASSSAFKELQHKNLISKHRTITPSDSSVEGAGGKRGIGTTGATFTITEEGQEVLRTL